MPPRKGLGNDMGKPVRGGDDHPRCMKPRVQGLNYSPNCIEPCWKEARQGSLRRLIRGTPNPRSPDNAGLKEIDMSMR